jgi:hypothetical protein
MIYPKPINPTRIASRPLAAALLLLAGLALTGCASGGLTSIGLPSDSPYTGFQTVLGSTHSDLTVTPVGDILSATLTPQGQGFVCFTAQGGFFAGCNSSDCASVFPGDECDAQKPPGTTVTGFDVNLVTGYSLEATLKHPGFVIGLLRFNSATAGPVGTFSLSTSGASVIKLSAKQGSDLIFGPSFPYPGEGSSQLESATLADEFAGLLLTPGWPAMDNGYVCTDGTTTSCDPSQSPTGVLAACDHEGDDGDQLIFRVKDAQLTGRKLQCGNVTFNFYVNPPFANLNQCIAFLLYQNCFRDIAPANQGSCMVAQILNCLLNP